MLASYQEVVRSLLDQTHYPGLSVDELELFKIHFGTAAFTCRLSSCPRTTLGFETEKLRSEHEMSHVRCFRCTFPGCQYPPFASARALRNHTSKHHTPTIGRKAIRNVTSEHSYQRFHLNMRTPGNQGTQENQEPFEPSRQHSIQPQQRYPIMYQPSHMQSFPTLSDEEKTKYAENLQGFWNVVHNSPSNSSENMVARERIIEFSRTLNSKVQQRRTARLHQVQEQRLKQPEQE